MTIYHDSIDDSSTGSGEVRETCVPLTIGWRENLFRFSWIDVHTYEKILPWLCQFSESTLLDLWPHLKYSMQPSSIFHGIPESLYYCLKCHCYPTRHGLVRSGSGKWKNRGFQIILTQIKKYGISHFFVTFKGWWFVKTDCQIVLVAGCSCCLLRLLLLTFDLRSWKTAVTHSREGLARVMK